MLVDEAKKRVCPMIFFEGDCIGPKCMAWRWNYEAMVIGETVGGKKILTNGKRLMSENDGYCGLAGKEGTE